MTLNARDDPIAVINELNEERIRETAMNSNAFVSVMTYSGGHLGWVSGKRSARGWDDDVVLSFADELVAEFHERQLIAAKN